MPTQLVYALRCVDGEALTHWGTVWSSRVWICRRTSGRSEENILGTQYRRCMKEGNCMVARMALVLWLIACKQVGWILEQPRSSLMEFHPFIVDRRAMFGWMATSMGAFGAETQKPTKLKGSVPWVLNVQRTVTTNHRAHMGASYTAIRLEPHPCGENKRRSGSHTLKQTQVHPQEFADAVLSEWVQAKVNGALPLSFMAVGADNAPVRNWTDFADMTPVYALMRMDPSIVPPGVD